jgi:UDPglucose--hexose-1-phosphate uridylyltransferase
MKGIDLTVNHKTEERMIYKGIKRLVIYALKTGLIEADDIDYTINRLLELFQVEDYQDLEGEDILVQAELISEEDLQLEDILSSLLEYAQGAGLVEDSIVYKDLFDTRVMGIITPRPSEIIAKFKKEYAKSPREATDFYYNFSQATDYIRRYRIKKDVKWVTKTQYGDLDITINLSKPEKDPKAIAAAKHAKQSGYPKCLLCKENVGYAGRVDHPARQNHRVIPITIHGQDWGFQYSPYVYYNEHCIVFNNEHIPMKIEKATFRKLLDFVALFPHYFVGSNADLPIVGGSILSHDHFQGGNYEFAMAKAKVEFEFKIPGYEDVEAGIVAWPMSVLRIRSKEDKRLVELADHILQKWRGYSDEAADIYSETNQEPHNTITPIARMRDGSYELDLVLRNNLSTKEHPLGVFHPHAELHHIKKENIGLIEVMGLAVLPARLKDEMELLGQYILENKNPRSNEVLEKHADWLEGFLGNYSEVSSDNVNEILQEEVGKVFLQVLTHAGVYKRTVEGQEAFHRFILSL